MSNSVALACRLLHAECPQRVYRIQCAEVHTHIYVRWGPLRPFATSRIPPSFETTNDRAQRAMPNIGLVAMRRPARQRLGTRLLIELPASLDRAIPLECGHTICRRGTRFSSRTFWLLRRRDAHSRPHCLRSRGRWTLLRWLVPTCRLRTHRGPWYWFAANGRVSRPRRTCQCRSSDPRSIRPWQAEEGTPDSVGWADQGGNVLSTDSRLEDARTDPGSSYIAPGGPFCSWDRCNAVSSSVFAYCLRPSVSNSRNSAPS